MSRTFFNGRQLTTPQSASALDESAMSNPNLSVGRVAALVGRAIGIKPFTAITFASADEARKVISDDITIKAIERAFDPSSETTGPSQLVFVGVNPSTQAAGALKAAADATVINLKATMWGRPGNQIKVKVESGSISGKKLTTQLGNDYYSEDNVGRAALSVRYTGAENAATIAVAEAAVTLVYGANTATIDLAEFPTVQQLVDRIGGVPGFIANVLDGNSEKPTLKGLDFLAATDCKAATITVRADLQACVDWFNGVSEGFIEAERVDGAGAAPVNTPFFYLSGAVDGDVTNAEWQKAFEVLQQEDVQFVTPLSPLTSVHTMADTHCAFMSNIAGKFRRSYCGLGTGATDADAATAAKALNSDRTGLVTIGVRDFNGKGQMTLYPAYVAAALMSGMHAGVNPGTPLTNKSIKVRGLERKLRIPTDSDFLLNAGVIPLEDSAAGFKIVQSITTWRNNDNFNRCEMAVGDALDFTMRNVQEAVDSVRGKKGTPMWMREAMSRAETALNALAKPEPLGPGVLVGDAENPAWRKLQVNLVADVVSLQYECSPVIGINYVLQTVKPSPYSGSAGG